MSPIPTTILQYICMPNGINTIAQRVPRSSRDCEQSLWELEESPLLTPHTYYKTIPPPPFFLIPKKIQGHKLSIKQIGTCLKFVK